MATIEWIHGHVEGDLCNFYCYQRLTLWGRIKHSLHLV